VERIAGGTADKKDGTHYSIICDDMEIYPGRDGNPPGRPCGECPWPCPGGECFGMLGPNGGEESSISMVSSGPVLTPLPSSEPCLGSLQPYLPMPPHASPCLPMPFHASPCLPMPFHASPCLTSFSSPSALCPTSSGACRPCQARTQGGC